MTTLRKFMLASDLDETKLRFPIEAQPKIDGVRGGNLNGVFTGRSLKPFGNEYICEFFGQEIFEGFDGELAAEHECHPDLCRLTTSATSTHAGEPWLMWHVFDYITPETELLEYWLRYKAMNQRVATIKSLHPELGVHLRVVPSKTVYSLEELLQFEEECIDKGYEGIIVRDPYGKNKQGRSTIREMGLLRKKQFQIDEALVTGVEEGQTNLNEAVRDARGYIERSTHKANMVPNGKVGTLLCIDLKTKKPIRVSAGRMNHDERERYLREPHLIINQIIKYQNFAHGVKDAPRQATFQCIRSKDDMDPEA